MAFFWANNCVIELPMICSSCGQENSNPFGYCTGCQRPLSTVGGAAAMPAMDPVGPPQPRTMSIAARVFLILSVLAGLTLGIFKPAEPADPAKMFGEHLGALIFLLGLPALIAFIFAGRRKVRHPNRFVLIFCVLSGFFTLANAATMFSFETPEARFTRLMREAAGLQRKRTRAFRDSSVLTTKSASNIAFCCSRIVTTRKPSAN